MFGGSPNTITGDEQARAWKDMLGKIDAYQHIISCVHFFTHSYIVLPCRIATNEEHNSGVIPFLPQPGPGVKFPEKANACANASVVMIRHGTKGGEELRDGVS
jgi:hypothetical protein